jgi:hypothetical protein
MGSDRSLLFSSEILSALVFFGEIRPPVAVSNKFSTGIEVLTIFIFIFMGLHIVYSKLFQLEGEVLRVYFYVFFVCLFLPSWIYMINMI